MNHIKAGDKKQSRDQEVYFGRTGSTIKNRLPNEILLRVVITEEYQN